MVGSTVRQVRQVQGFRQQVDRQFETSASRWQQNDGRFGGSTVQPVQRTAHLWTSGATIVGCWTRATYRTWYIYPLEQHSLRTFCAMVKGPNNPCRLPRLTRSMTPRLAPCATPCSSSI